MVDGVKICTATLDFDSDYKVTPVKLRGFLAHLFANISEFHHHSDNSYHYPLIQYKRIEKKLAVIGIDKFAEIVFQNISGLDHITTETQKIPLNNIEIKNSVYVVEQTSGKYKFTTPWLALNEKNYTKFKELKNNEKKSFLEKILVGNILSLLKGLKIFVDYKITISITKSNSIQVTAHQNKFAGIYAEFECNVTLPDYLGLGKSVTKGFGVVQKI
jgi:hypothetical protein